MRLTHNDAVGWLIVSSDHYVALDQLRYHLDFEHDDNVIRWIESDLLMERLTGFVIGTKYGHLPTEASISDLITELEDVFMNRVDHPYQHQDKLLLLDLFSDLCDDDETLIKLRLIV